MTSSVIEDINLILIQWMKEQNQLKEKLIQIDDFKLDELRLIGGVDISFVKGTMKACACLIIKSWPKLETIYSDVIIVTLTYPYIPGFLAFREIPALLQLIDKLKAIKPEYIPDVILVDGNGILHPNGFGLASHLGVLINIPTIGVGKTILYMDSLDKKTIKDSINSMEKSDVGDYRPIISNKENKSEIIGNILKTVQHDGSNQNIQGAGTIYISVGHRISLSTATQLVTKCIKYKVPEPIREADFLSRKFLRENYI